MFTIPGVNVIESDEGFSVEVLGRTGLVYREGHRQLRVDSELLSGPSGLLMYSSSIVRWAPPHDEVAIDEAERQRIVGRIRAAFAFRGLDIVVN